MLFSSCLRNRKVSLNRRGERKRMRCGGSTVRRIAPRLVLEALEDRVVPASLDYSTLMPSPVLATAVDSSDDVYAAGTGGVAKLNSTGTAVLYQTQLGSAVSGIALDAAGDAYVIGVGQNIPTTPNAIASAPDGSYSSGEDVFVAELDPNGNLLYATYLPGAVSYPMSADYVGAIAVDGSGNIDVAGGAGAGLPVTANAFQTSLGGSGDNAFFMKIDPALSGTASVLYASYLGGSGGDEASAIALDSSGNAYLYGSTSSSNFPTTSGAFRRTYGGGQDAFVAKFDPALSGAASLVFSTYLGGSSTDGFVHDDLNHPNNYANTDNPAGGIAVDSSGNVYVTGSTMSTNFPTTSGAYQTTSKIVNTKYNKDATDVFVTKLNATGSALVYSTYLGGGSNPFQINGKKTSVGTYSGGCGIAVDASGDAYVTGWTNSTSFPTKNPIQATNKGGLLSNGFEGNNAFVTALNPSGSGLLFSTYLGGSDADGPETVGGFSIGLDSAANVYVAGEVPSSTSSTFPTTAGAYDTTSGSGFVAKIGGVNASTPAIASASSTPTASSGSSQTQASNAPPVSSQVAQLFTLAGANSAGSAIPALLSELVSEWQSWESALLTRFDLLLSMEFNAYMHNAAADAQMADLFFASRSVPSSI